MQKHVAVLKGGWSRDRDKSLAGASAISTALEAQGYQITEIDIDRNFASALQALKPDVVFNALHGGAGENGSVQGILETLDIPYTHSGILASGLTTNKHRAKILFKAAGVPVTNHIIAHRAEIARGHVMPPPYIIKPFDAGGSFGVHLLEGESELPPAAILAADWDGGDELMVERYIPGRELTCAIVGDVAIGVAEIQYDGKFLTRDMKIEKDSSNLLFPAPISSKIYDQVQNMSLKAHTALGCRGVTKVDFRFNDRAGVDGELVCLEVNTQPALAETSLVPELAAFAGQPYGEFLSWIVEDASCNR